MKRIASLVIWERRSIQCLQEEKTMCPLRGNVTELESLQVVNTIPVTKALRGMDQHILFRRVEEMEMLEFSKIHQEQEHITLMLL